MSGNPHTLAAFHLLGERPAVEPGEAARQAMRPALFSGFQDLAKVRYDFPLVLIADSGGEESIKSLSDIVDGILGEIAAQGSEGEQTRLQILSLEQEIRGIVASGQHGSLADLWDMAAEKVFAITAETDQPALQETLRQARDKLTDDGEVIDCDAHLPARLISRLWQASQLGKQQELRTRIDTLVQKLADILQVDYLHTAQARSKGKLQRSVGSVDQDVFDFQAMAKILKTAPVGDLLPASRQERLRAAIEVLENQRFVAEKIGSGKKLRIKGAFKFEFNGCGKARAAYRKLLPEMANLVKAISIAELEIENRYDESQHDKYFDHFGENSLGPDDLAMFPSYLVCINDRVASANTQADILETISSGLPFKIMAQSNDILDDPAAPAQQLSFGVKGQQLAGMAVGLNSVFVVQAASSSLYCLRKSLVHGLAGARPMLLSVYAGAPANAYILAAAATESRAFPSFIYDPDAEGGLASRYGLKGNPQLQHDWPIHPLQYEDSDHNRLSENCAFTLIDFLACDERQARHFINVVKDEWHEDMLPVAEFLTLDAGAALDKVPYTLLLNEENILQRAVVDQRLIEAAERCQESWHDLQELGGINNSYAAASLSEAEALWQEEKQQLLQQATSQPAPQPAGTPQPEAPVATDAQAPVVATEAPEPLAVSSDDAWIETLRCTTCNECTELNNRMFAYNDDMQAYIQDPDAGTYRDMVEAAETCQVAIIHPGKPRDPGEPDLESLIARADPFI